MKVIFLDFRPFNTFHGYAVHNSNWSPVQCPLPALHLGTGQPCTPPHFQVELDASELLAAVGGGAPAAPDLALEAEGLVLDQVPGHLKSVFYTS